MHYAWPASLTASPPTNLSIHDACGMSEKNRSWLPLGVSKKIQPRVAEKACYNLWHWKKILTLLWDYSWVRRAFRKEAGHEGEEWQQRLRQGQGLERKTVLHPVCWVSMDRGQREESQGIWSPFACAGWAGPGTMEPVACGERSSGPNTCLVYRIQKVCF